MTYIMYHILYKCLNDLLFKQCWDAYIWYGYGYIFFISAIFSAISYIVNWATTYLPVHINYVDVYLQY